MRNFWIAIGVLAVIAVVVMWRSSANEGDRSTPGGSLIASNAVREPAQAMAVEVRGDAQASPSAAAPNNDHAAAGNALRSPKSETPNQPQTPTPAVGDQSTDAQSLADDLMDSADQAQGDDLDQALGGEGSGAAALAADGSTPIVDGKLIVGGDGSEDDPYQITWDLLILASQTYQPREGLTDLPPQVEAVNGKHIVIAGYFAVPLASTDPKEILFMLNMWDGCCIGVPPSPYDAIEVRLKEPLGGGKQFVTYGTLTGTLKVDPYVQNGWLLGMYVMEDGVLAIDM